MNLIGHTVAFSEVLQSNMDQDTEFCIEPPQRRCYLQVEVTGTDGHHMNSADVCGSERDVVSKGCWYRCLLKMAGQLVSWCFAPSQPQRTTSGLNTNFTLSPSQSFHKSSYHKVTFFFSLFIFRGHSTREPTSSRVTYFILWAHTGTVCQPQPIQEKSGEVLEKMQVNGPEGQK